MRLLIITFSYLLLLIGFNCCSLFSKKDKVCGVYSSSSVINAGGAEMKLIKNGNFYYKWEKGLLFGDTKGSWFVINDSTYIINSTNTKEIDEASSTEFIILPRTEVVFNFDTIVLSKNCLYFKDSSFICRVKSN